MNATESIQTLLHRLLESQKYAVLATDQHGQPYTSLMAFSATPDLQSFILLTETGRLKYANLMTNPRVALFIDNRENVGADIEEAIAVTAQGVADEVVGEEREVLRDFFLRRHPGLRVFASAPKCALIRIKINSYVIVRRFQEVIEWRIEN
jgi:nitroimidazol reductase NimA-like FMN-containing flavoprotein (pyridoxamine 5'-phosphate oxidase superfamily)